MAIISRIAVLMAGCGTNPTPGSEATNHIGDPKDMTAVCDEND